MGQALPPATPRCAQSAADLIVAQASEPAVPSFGPTLAGLPFYPRLTDLRFWITYQQARGRRRFHRSARDNPAAFNRAPRGLEMGVTVDGEDAKPSSRGGVGTEWMDLAVSVAVLGSSPASKGSPLQGGTSSTVCAGATRRTRGRGGSGCTLSSSSVFDGSHAIRLGRIRLGSGAPAGPETGDITLSLDARVEASIGLGGRLAVLKPRGGFGGMKLCLDAVLCLISTVNDRRAGLRNMFSRLNDGYAWSAYHTRQPRYQTVPNIKSS
jgi:hypothetical protein